MGSIARDAYSINPGAAKLDLRRIFSIKHEFPTAYNKLFHPNDTDLQQKIDINLDGNRFPYIYDPKSIQIQKILLFLKMNYGFAYTDPLQVTIKTSDLDEGKTFVTKTEWGDLPYFEFDMHAPDGLIPSKFTLEINREKGANDTIPSELRQKEDGTQEDSLTNINGKEYFRINPEAIENIAMVVVYSANLR